MNGASAVSGALKCVAMNGASASVHQRRGGHCGDLSCCRRTVEGALKRVHCSAGAALHWRAARGLGFTEAHMAAPATQGMVEAPSDRLRSWQHCCTVAGYRSRQGHRSLILASIDACFHWCLPSLVVALRLGFPVALGNGLIKPWHHISRFLPRRSRSCTGPTSERSRPLLRPPRR